MIPLLCSLWTQIALTGAIMDQAYRLLSVADYSAIVKFYSLALIAVLSLAISSHSSGQQNARSDANEFYVSADAQPGGDGSQPSPFLRLAEAESVAAAGDTIFLLASRQDKILDGGIELKPGQKLLGVGANGQLQDRSGERVKLTNSGDGVIVQLSLNNEIAGIHFMNMSNYAISGADTDYSGAYIHHASFSGNAVQHIEDERGVVYAVSFNGVEGALDNIRIEDSSFFDGEDLGAIRVFHSGASSGRYLFQRNTFTDLGGRAYFVRTRNSSFVETVILDSTANNIGRGNRNSDSIIPYLMGQSEQIMLVKNYHFNNTKQEGNQSNTGIEAFIFGYPRTDEANFCTACKLTFKIIDSVIENAYSDSIQFSNSGVNSDLSYEIRNTKIIGGNPQQGGGGISLNLQSVADSGSRTTLLVENTDIIGTSGYGFAMNNRGGGDISATADFGGGALGSIGHNRFSDNARGEIRVTGKQISASNNWWGGNNPTIYNADNVVTTDSKVVYTPVLTENPR